MKGRISMQFVVTATLLAGTILLTGMVARRVPQPLAVPLDRIDSEIAGWTAVKGSTLDEHTLRALDATSYLARAYGKQGQELELFIAFYAQQRAGESMHSPKACLPGTGWEIWRHDSATVPVNGKQIHINKYSIQNLAARMLMLYWYQSQDRIVASEYVGKILLARDTLLTGRTSGSIVRIILPDAPGAAEEGIVFASRLIPEVQRCFSGEQHPTVK
jgi:EpsI family protein